MKAHATVLSVLFVVSGSLLVLVALPPARVAGRVSPQATLTVHSSADGGGSCPGPGCTLRQAIAVAMPGDTIDFDPSVMNITLASELPIDKSLTIAGPGAGVLTISGNNSTRVFNIGSSNPAINVTISGVTIANGLHRGADGAPGGDGFGGGILNLSSGTLALTNVVLSNNSAVGGNDNTSTGASGGNAGKGFGGALDNAGTGTVNVTNSMLANNKALGGSYNHNISENTVTQSGGGLAAGGAIYNASTGTINIISCLLSNNSATSGDIRAAFGAGITLDFGARGGGIDNASGTMNVTGSTLSSNLARSGTTIMRPICSACSHLKFGGFGGGISNGGALKLTNTTFFDNSANGGTFIPCPSGSMSCFATGLNSDGGGILNAGGTVTLTNVTLSGNSATGVNGVGGGPSGVGIGGGIDNGLTPGTVNSKDTLIAKNIADTGPDVSGALASQGYNLIGNNKDAVIVAMTGDQIGTPAMPINPLLGPLQNNGGPTPTMVLLAGSPAIDQGAAAIDPITQLPITTDQRGLPRPADDAAIPNAPGGDGSDIGAFEVQCNFTCPPNQTAIAGTNPCATVNYPPPTTSGSCGAMVSCLPPSGTCFPVGTTTVTCTEIDGSGNTAQCGFTVTVTSFDLCLQDDGNPSTVLLVNSQTGDYRFCCGGTAFTGRGRVTIHGSIYTLQHNASDRRVSMTDDESVHKGTASVQVPAGVLRCTISDRDTRNNTCSCGAAR